MPCNIIHHPSYIIHILDWDSCEEKNNDDDKYMLSRFTELLLVHFAYLIDKVIIE